MPDRVVHLSKHEVVVDREWVENLLQIMRTNQDVDWYTDENDPADEFRRLEEEFTWIEQDSDQTE